VKNILKNASRVLSRAKALGLMLDAPLSKHQYEILRKATKLIGCDIFPHYKKGLKRL
jgi:hypothetical protein